MIVQCVSNRACAPTGTSCLINNNFVPCCNPADTCSPYIEDNQLKAYCNPTTQTPSPPTTQTTGPTSSSSSTSTTSSHSTSAGCKQQGEPCNLSVPNDCCNGDCQLTFDNGEGKCSGWIPIDKSL